MREWIVYSKDGATERCRLKKLEYGGSFMGERAITSTFVSPVEISFGVFDYIEYRGEQFELETIPTVKKTSSFSYEYDLRFVSYKYELERCEMRDIVPYDNGIVYPTPLTFSFMGDVKYLAERIQACLDAMYGIGLWNIHIAEGVTSDEHNITIAQQNCWNALSLVNTTYKLNFYIKGRYITIGGFQPVVEHTFEYGKGNGLYEIERTANTDTGIVTKLRAYGSTRNLDYSYPKRPDWSDSILDTSFVLSPLRLMLPSFKHDGVTDYVMASNELVSKYGVREASIVYEDIYPSITGATNSKGEAIDEIKSVGEVGESTFVVGLHDLGFDLEEHLTNDSAQVSMKSGRLQGYSFNIQNIEKQEDNSYLLTLERITLSEGDTDNYNVPNSGWNMSVGDKFVLLNILMPQEYIRDAEERLLARAEEYLAQYGKTNFSYSIGMHDKFLVENPSVYDGIIEGSKLRIHDEQLGISEDVTIQSVTITENMEENILPQVKVVLNNEPSASTLERIQGQINDLANGNSGGYSKQGDVLNQYRRKLDRPYFDKLFVAVDKDGNEISSNDLTTEVFYIKARYHLATVGGLTSFIDDGFQNLPQIYDGLAIDNQTIVWEEVDGVKTLVAKGGGSGEGTIKDISIGGSGNAITNVSLSSDGTGLVFTKGLEFALKTDFDTTKKKLEDFLEGSDTDTIINRWKELEAFLSGLAETDNLAKILENKADKKYVEDNFVTLNTSQTITGAKDFTGGLKVNGCELVYDASKKYWKLTGDLLVTGGITSFADDTAFVPSTITDAVLIDEETLGRNEYGQLYVKGASGGGTVKFPLTWTGFANGSWDGSEAKTIYIPSKLSEFTDDLVKGKYLPLSGGTLTGQLTVKSGTGSDFDIHTHKIRVPISAEGSGISTNWADTFTDSTGYERPWYGLSFGTGNDTSKLILASYFGMTLKTGDNGRHFVFDGGRIQSLVATGTAPISVSSTTMCPNLNAEMLGGKRLSDVFANHGWVEVDANKPLFGLYYQGGSSSTNLPNINGQLIAFNCIDGGYTGAQLFSNSDGRLFSRNRWNNNWSAWKVIAFTDSNITGNAATASALSSINTFSKGLNVLYHYGFIEKGERADGSWDAPFGGYEQNGVIGEYGGILRINKGSGSYYYTDLFFNSNDSSIYAKRVSNGQSRGWNQIAFTSSNVASATKLQTSRKIWGQPFDGTGDVDGLLTVNGNAIFSGNVGIGTTSPAYKLDVNGTMRVSGATTLQSTLNVAGSSVFSGITNHNAGLRTDTIYLGQGAITNNVTGLAIRDLRGINISTHYEAPLLLSVSEVSLYGGRFRHNPTTKCFEFDGNLVVTGGITAFSENGLGNQWTDRIKEALSGISSTSTTAQIGEALQRLYEAF